MKSITKFSLFIIILFFSFCKSQTEIEEIDIPALRVSSIYNFDSVNNFKIIHAENYKSLANEYLNKGINQEDVNLKKAIWNVKRAITLFPNYENYIKLGELLMKDKQFQEAANLYEFIVFKCSRKQNDEWIENYVFEAPNESLFTEYFVANFLASYFVDFQISYMCEEAGFKLANIKERFFNDKRIVFDTASNDYKNMLLCFLSEEELENYAKNPSNFVKFLDEIKSNTSQFEINKYQVSNFNYEDYNGRNWNEGLNLVSMQAMFLNEKKDNPNNSVSYNCLNKCYINDSVIVIHYSVDTSENACPKEMRHICHVLATYSKNGNVIDYKVVAAQSGEYLSIFSFNNGIINCNEYKRTWKEVYYKFDFNNELLKTDFVKEKVFKINELGKFMEVNASM
jgi:tetratricopeptide (TPR) repeat protein